MKRLNWIFVMMAGLCLSGSLLAAESGSSDLVNTDAYNKQQSSPLPAGSKVVAGKQNDFFILPGSDSAAGMNIAENKSESKADIVAANNDVSEHPALASKSSKQDESNIKVALSRTLHGKGNKHHLALAAKGKPAGRNLASNHHQHHVKQKVKHHLASKSRSRHAAKIKLASHTHHSKVKRAQVRV